MCSLTKPQVVYPQLKEVPIPNIMANPLFSFFFTENSANQPTQPLPLQTLVLWQTGKNYWLVQGLKELQHHKNQKRAFCTALVFTSFKEPVQLWKYLAENQQPVSLFSKFQALQSLYEELQLKSFESLFEQLEPLSWLNPRAKSQLLFLMKNQQLLVGFVSLKFITYNDAKLLQKFSLADLSVLAEMFTGFNLHGNRLKILLGLVVDIQFGQGLSIKKIQSAVQPTAVESNPNKRYTKTQNALHTLRYPHWAGLKQQWQVAVKDLKLPKEVQVLANTDFEQTELSLLIQSSTPTQLQALLVDLQKKLQIAPFKKLYQWL